MAKITVATAAEAASTFVRDKALTNAAVVVASGSSNIRMLDCDNTANTGAVTYFKFFNLAAASVVFHASTPGSSTNPSIVIPATAGKRIVVTIDTTDVTFATALSTAAVTTGGTLGTTAPTAVVGVRILLA